jgi:hypothetical protein
MTKKTIQMKHILLAIIFVCGIAGLASAQGQGQGIRLNLYSAYVFDDNVDSYYSTTSYFNGTIKGGYQWGAGIEYMVRETKGIEIKYLRRDCSAPMTYYMDGVKNKTFDLAMNYVLIGGSNYFQTGGKVEPYAGAAIGLGIVTLKNSTQSDNTYTKFAWDIKLGTNIWASERVAIKLQADLQSMVQSVGGGVYFGTGGAGAGVTTYSTMYQWVLGGGLTFKLGQQ